MVELELQIQQKDNYYEFTSRNIILGKLITLQDRSILVIDVISPWEYPIDKSIEINGKKLVYHYEIINDELIEKIEYVGYISGNFRDLISLRLYFKKVIDLELAKQYLIQYLSKYRKDLIDLLSKKE